jgi:CheY-like chemotaxis protein
MNRIVIVDDHPAFRAWARAVLAADGFRVAGEAADAASAVAEVRAVRPDVVLLDVQLPDGDGFEVAEALRAARPRPAARLDLQPGCRGLCGRPGPDRPAVHHQGGPVRTGDQGDAGGPGVSRRWLILTGLAGLAVLIPALAVPFMGHTKDYAPINVLQFVA